MIIPGPVREPGLRSRIPYPSDDRKLSGRRHHVSNPRLPIPKELSNAHTSAGYQTDTIDTSQYNTRIIPYQNFDTQVTSNWWYQTLY